MARMISVTECGRTVYLDCDSVALIRPHLQLATASHVMMKGGLMLLIEEEPAALHRMVVEGLPHPKPPCPPSPPAPPSRRPS